MENKTNNLFFLFTKEAAHFLDVNSDVTREDLNSVKTVGISFLNGNQSPEGMKDFILNKDAIADNVFLVVEDPEDGIMVQAAKQQFVNIIPVNEIPRIYGSWNSGLV